ncbi:SagB/ThcOx family dehydrogenase [Paraburkholderia panacisoli]|uniref:SagB/ThcOx family dehydrogenase n=2 Tax=Paraburkholderia panacisoli TaxID=2603818 RepID=A0A5B0GWQ0_9BURK|nr:SagB/ThcOx family dehydrogenase [Paraburkholderia panacisoli]
MDRLRHAMLEYHERSKHRVSGYAPGPGKLDWATQPDPFRVFHGAPRIGLPLAADSLTTRYNELRCGALPPARRFDLSGLAILFELSLGLSAWKSYGTQRWALRCNPSSGNLHPTEGYLLCPTLPGLSGGVYHYLSRDHSLECRAAVDDERWSEALPQSGVLVGISSIPWREAWKYGMRAWRYCQHDCGHVIAAVSYAAAALGWQTRLVEAAADDAVANLLGLNRGEDFGKAEPEAPDALLWIGNPELRPDLERMLVALDSVQWHGRANQLSPGHVKWPDIDSIYRATHKARTREPALPNPEEHPSPAAPALDLSFARIARQRRSAMNFDGTACIDKAAFFSMLACLLPRHDTPPWNALMSPAAVHAALMVHRVGDLEPGLYMFVRSPGALSDLKRSLRPEWLWQKIGPDHLPLYLLLPYDLRATAKLICCHQDIGADSCFALGMIAGFGIALKQPWRYRHLFWECGILGQALYLEAEAAGVRATGIGCFFDDEMHALLGVEDHTWQSLYHFTVGRAVDDQRLSTCPPYEVQP